MNRDKMIEALAKAAYCHDGAKPYPWDPAAKGDKYADQWALQRSQAESIAAAVLDLCGPEKLVWTDSKIFKACYSGPYTVQHEHSGDVQVWCAVIDGVIFAEGDSKAAAQAATQSHADAAHWANTPLGKLVGV